MEPAVEPPMESGPYHDPLVREPRVDSGVDHNGPMMDTGTDHNGSVMEPRTDHNGPVIIIIYCAKR